MNRKGFISMTLVYSFLIVFLFTMLEVLEAYSEKVKYTNAIDELVSEDLSISKGANSTLMNKLLIDNVPNDSSSLDFSRIANLENGNGNGFYYVDDSGITDENADGVGGRIYYFRGHVDNNYVVIAQADNGEYEDNLKKTCWRIVRTNEDGSIRMRYNGKASYDSDKGYSCSNVDGIAISQFNIFVKAGVDDNAYVGYMYAGNNISGADKTFYVTAADKKNAISSTAKIAIDSWYEDEFYMFNSILQDTIYCSNKTITSGGYQRSTTVYGLSKINKSYYSFKCEKPGDRLSMSTSVGGNNTYVTSLTYPIGLLTLDDVIFAGGSYESANKDYYLYIDKKYKENDSRYAYWTMTPSEYSNRANDSGSFVFYVDSEGAIKNGITQVSTLGLDRLYLFPAISVKYNVGVAYGSGKVNDPYVIKVDTEE